MLTHPMAGLMLRGKSTFTMMSREGSPVNNKTFALAAKQACGAFRPALETMHARPSL
jgi:hypothetical protein